MSVEFDRIDRVLEKLAADMSEVREQLGSLSARISNMANAHDRIDGVRADLSAHEKNSAGQHARIDAEVQRLWWGVRICLTAVVTALVGLIVRVFAG